MRALEISLSGLDVEYRRLEVIAQNLANMNTTRTEAGGAYRALKLVSGPSASFQSLMSSTSAQPVGVQVLGVEETAGALRRVYEPQHPHADADGFVEYPSVDHAGEMALMLRAARVYEANLAAASLAQDMYARALEIGR